MMLIVKCYILYIFSTIIFDIVHYIAHKYHFKWHTYHHLYFDNKLKFNDEYINKNITYHILVEYAIQVLSIICFLNSQYGLITLVIITIKTMLQTCYIKGKDANHTNAKNDNPIFFVTPGYHASHHIYPNKNFGSYITIIDYIFGSKC